MGRMENVPTKSKNLKRTAFAFIVIMAFVSMFSDMTHEGSNSIIGAFEKFLGADPFTISLVSGLGLFIGYSLRLLTGYLADKTKKYWLITILGYVIDLFAVPLLCLVPENGWLLAAFFILLEKAGKAIKKPAKNTLVSFAAKANGTGKSFAFSELLDQIGAFVGPLILTLTYWLRGDLSDYDRYRLGFLVLGIPAILCLVLLIIARILYANPSTFEKEETVAAPKSSLKKSSFILFCIGGALLAIGFVGYPLALSQFNNYNLFETRYLPLLYSYAMLIDAFAALIFGSLYDRFGLYVVGISTAFSIGASFFMFMIADYWAVFLGLTLWGIGQGAMESVVLSGVTDLTGKNDRAKAFGIFDTLFGLCSLGGSALIGLLYEASILWMCIFSAFFIAASSLFFVLSYFALKKEKTLTISPASNSEEK